MEIWIVNSSAYPNLLQSRNFALNPKEGVKIHAFKNAHTPQAASDRELHLLTRYMLHVAPVDDFRTLKHKASSKALLSLSCLIHPSRIGEILPKPLAHDTCSPLLSTFFVYYLHETYVPGCSSRTIQYDAL